MTPPRRIQVIRLSGGVASQLAGTASPEAGRIMPHDAGVVSKKLSYTLTGSYPRQDIAFRATLGEPLPLKASASERCGDSEKIHLELGLR